MHQRNRYYTSGLTLLELSVVLVLIALIIGGIVLGRSLITTARIQSVITDEDSYMTAANNFKQTYGSLPGDFPGATAMWGYGGETGCTNNAGTGTVTNGTCDGNGDGMINNTSGSANQAGEPFLFWQQLNLAKMAFISLRSNVAGLAGAYDSIPGVNVPASGPKGGGFSIVWFGTITVPNCFDSGTIPMACYYPQSFGNALLYGQVVSGNPTIGPILTPDQAASIDAKIDDGLPNSGKVQTYMMYNLNLSPCVTAYGPPVAYFSSSTTSSTPACALIFLGL